MESCLHQTPQKVWQNPAAAFLLARVARKSPRSVLNTHLGFWLQLLLSAPPSTQVFSLYRKTIYAAITTLQSHWEESLSQPAGHNRGEEVLELPVTQSTSHISANDHTSEGLGWWWWYLLGIQQNPVSVLAEQCGDVSRSQKPEWLPLHTYSFYKSFLEGAIFFLPLLSLSGTCMWVSDVLSLTTLISFFFL